MSFIGIDLGTSFIKGAVLDLDNYSLRHIQRVPFPDPIPGKPALFWEFDPAKVMEAIQRLLENLVPYAGHCEGLVMCSQMHGLVFTTPDGKARSTLTTWQDQRVMMPHPSGKGTYFDVFRQKITPEENRQMGNEIRPGQPAGLLFWMAEQGLLPKGDLVLASLPDFVIANLCSTSPVTEVSNAMAHGVLNLETLDWHHEVISKFGLTDLKWPQILPHGTKVGEFHFDDQTIPCFTPVGDYQCALLGALLRPNELSLNISTGSQVSMLKPKIEFGNYQTRPFFDGHCLIGVTHIPAGRSLNLLVKLLSELTLAQGSELADPWAYITKSAAEAKSGPMRINLSFFTSSVGSEGEITHIREEEMTVGHLFRAAFQNMTDNYYACALRLSPQQEWHNLVFSGGLAQKIPVLRQMICDQFTVDYRMCPTSEDTLLGLMALALAFSHRQPDVDHAVALLEHSYSPIA